MRILIFFIAALMWNCKDSPSTNKAVSEHQISEQSLPDLSGDFIAHLVQHDKNKDVDAIYVLVRHAEKELNVEDPGLTQEGQDRAKSLAESLKKVDLDVVLSTPYNRTLLTAQETAIEQNIEIEQYDPRDLQILTDRLQSDLKNKNVFIVGHSNTVPALVNSIMGGAELNDLPEDVYNQVYLIARMNTDELQLSIHTVDL